MLFTGVREGNENMWSKAICKEKKTPTCKLQSRWKLLFQGTVAFAETPISFEARMTLQDHPK